MKRSIMSVVLLLAAVSVYAADLDNFKLYGTVRMGSWLDRNEKFLKDELYKTKVYDTIKKDSVDVPVLGPDSRPDYHCNIIPHGKFGINYKSDAVGATIELKVQSAITGAYLPGATTDHIMYTERYFAEMYRFFAEWYLNDNMTLLIGQDYAPIGFLYSNQAFYDDNSFGNTGDLYGGRKPMIAFTFSNLKEAADLGIEAKAAILKVDTCSVLYGNDQTPTTDWKIPKFESSFLCRIGVDPITINAKVVGGFQQYFLSRRVTTLCYHPDSQIAQTVNCWAGGAHADAKIAGFSLAAGFALGQNLGAYGLYIGNPFVYRGSSLSDLSDIFYPSFGNNTDTAIKQQFLQYNSNAMEADIILQYRVFDGLGFEGGAGWVTAKNPDPRLTEYWHDTYAGYLQAEIKPIKPVSFTPEFGFYYFGPYKGYGMMLYAGMKSQIDF